MVITIYYVYILKCRDLTLYTGYTNDVNRRLEVHNDGKGSKYTRGRLPVTLVYYEQHSNKSSAMRREAEIKKLSRQEKLNLLKIPSVNNYTKLKEFS